MWVIDDDAFQGRTHRYNPACLVVLILLTDEQNAYLGIVDHELNLLLGTRGVERNGDGTNAPGGKVALDVLHGVLGKDSNILLWFDTDVQHGIRHLLDGR